MKRYSIVWTIDKIKLQELIDDSKSFSEVMIKLGYENIQGNLRTLKKRILEDNLDVSKLKQNKKLYLRKTFVHSIKPLEEILVENSNYCRGSLKSRLIDENCENTGIWNGMQITLQLEHINGISTDNRIENLCLLCPNCHSQTKTYAGKNNIHFKKICICGKNLPKNNKNGICQACAGDKKCKVYISKDELEKLLLTTPVTVIAKMYNLSDVSIRKKAEKFGLQHLMKPRGFWSAR
jgi:hypothetical protein